MKAIVFILLSSFLPLLISAQIGPASFVDTSIQSAGVTKLESADLNNDGFNEIIASFTGSSGKMGFYANLTNSSFSSFSSIDNLSFCRGLAAGDFNNDSLIDLVAIGGIGKEAKIYLNNGGLFGSGIQLDSNISIQVNDVVVAKFDQNSSDDIVIIGQHSIDLYKNNGGGNFTKQVILSTSTSPKSLECLDLDAKDMDNDGDMDLISGETEGLVIYLNNGNGIFSPNYYSVISEIIFLIHPLDIDNDGDLDVVCKNSFSDVKWFSNNGSGVMNYVATLSSVPNLHSISSADYNNDGLVDLYASYPNNISIFVNDSAHSFSNEINVYQDANLIMGAVQIANIDNLGNYDYIWSGGNNTIAFHLSQSTTAQEEVRSEQFSIYPNPTQGELYSARPFDKMFVYNSFGSMVLGAKGKSSVSLSNLPNGIYYVQIEKNGRKAFQKIVKY